MVKIITGNKGTGKTKVLIDLVHAAYEQSNGNVICVDQKRKLGRAINPRVRLVATEDYGIAGYDAFYGFLSGLCAGNYDITDIFVDATLRIGGRDFTCLAAFLMKVSKLDVNFFFTVSADKESLPEEILAFTADLCVK